jgi:hypothetical protein
MIEQASKRGKRVVSAIESLDTVEPIVLIERADSWLPLRACRQRLRPIVGSTRADTSASAKPTPSSSTYQSRATQAITCHSLCPSGPKETGFGESKSSDSC